MEFCDVECIEVFDEMTAISRRVVLPNEPAQTPGQPPAVPVLELSYSVREVFPISRWEPGKCLVVSRKAFSNRMGWGDETHPVAVGLWEECFPGVDVPAEILRVRQKVLQAKRGGNRAWLTAVERLQAKRGELRCRYCRASHDSDACPSWAWREK